MKKGDIITDPIDIKRRCYKQLYANKFHTGMTNFLKYADYQNWLKEEIKNPNSPISIKEI